MAPTPTLAAEQTGSKTEARSDQNSKYLSFKLAEEEFGLEILKVREIIGVMDITAVPQMPPHMKGVINLRGKVVPVIDLRLKFNLDEIAHTDQTCIIVVDVGREIGLIVDTVSEVLDVSQENIEEPPRLGSAVDTSFIRGLGKVGDAVKILLDIDEVVGDEALNHAAAAAVDVFSAPQEEF